MVSRGKEPRGGLEVQAGWPPVEARWLGLVTMVWRLQRKVNKRGSRLNEKHACCLFKDKRFFFMLLSHGAFW